MKPKPVNWSIIDKNDDPEIYDMVQDLVTKYHPDLENALFVVMWRSNWKMDQDNYITLVNIVKPSDMYRELREHDFIIGINKEIWPILDKEQQLAVLDNQLERATISRDKEGNTKLDEADRTIYRLRKDHIEGYSSISRRHNVTITSVQDYVATRLNNLVSDDQVADADDQAADDQAADDQATDDQATDDQVAGGK